MVFLMVIFLCTTQNFIKSLLEQLLLKAIFLSTWDCWKLQAQHRLLTGSKFVYFKNIRKIVLYGPVTDIAVILFQ